MDRRHEEGPSNDCISIDDMDDARFGYKLKACTGKVYLPLAMISLMAFLMLITMVNSSYRTQNVHFHNLTSVGILGSTSAVAYSDMPEKVGLSLRSPSKLLLNYVGLPVISSWQHATITSGLNKFWYDFPGSRRYHISGLASSHNISFSQTHHSGMMRITDTVDLSADHGISYSLQDLNHTPAHFNCDLGLGNAGVVEKYTLIDKVITLRASAGKPCIDLTLQPSLFYIVSFEFRSAAGNGALCFYNEDTCTSFIPLSYTRNWHKFTEIIEMSSYQSASLFVYGSPIEPGAVDVKYKNLIIYTPKHFSVPRSLTESMGSAH